MAGVLAGVIAGVLVAGIAAPTLATGDPGDSRDGLLDLNADVLVDESVRTGSVGDFAIRSRLFLEEIASRAHEQRAADTERLDVVDSLTFGSPAAVETYESVRAELFDGYAPRALSQTREAQGESRLLPVVALAVGVPIALLVGVSLGRFWARRKRGTA